MATLFPKIYDIIEQNPHKHATLRWSEPTPTQGSFFEQWENFSARPLDPPGALSILLLHTDPMYELGSLPLRKQILTEHLLQLHERVDKELVGRRYPRKKIQDLLAGQVSAQNATTSSLLEEVLCELFQVQKVHFHRRNKTIQFYPPDLRLWSTEKPILFAEEDNCWIFTPQENIRFDKWLIQKESEGWVISWPTADGKMDEIKGALVQRNMVLDGKHKKEDLSHMLGRAQALEILSGFTLEPTK